MSVSNNSKLIVIERVTISAKRYNSVKLWSASPHAQWGIIRTTIELQEVKLDEEIQPTYSQPLRLSCDSTTALLKKY